MAGLRQRRWPHPSADAESPCGEQSLQRPGGLPRAAGAGSQHEALRHEHVRGLSRGQDALAPQPHAGARGQQVHHHESPHRAPGVVAIRAPTTLRWPTRLRPEPARAARWRGRVLLRCARVRHPPLRPARVRGSTLHCAEPIGRQSRAMISALRSNAPWPLRQHRAGQRERSETNQSVQRPRRVGWLRRRARRRVRCGSASWPTHRVRRNG